MSNAARIAATFIGLGRGLGLAGSSRRTDNAVPAGMVRDFELVAGENWEDA
jgi:hypothetical protein